MKGEKLFPISANKSLCVRCEKCMYSCPTKAIFFKNSMRHVNYDKCEGCLRCVEACEHGAIEVISIQEGELKGFYIEKDKCALCLSCLEPSFCFQNLFSLDKENEGQEYIAFNIKSLTECQKCLKCFKSCPSNAIIPQID